MAPRKPLSPDAARLPAGLQRIVLTGFMGAGKTSAGRELARRLGWSFADLDVIVEERTGISIAELFQRDGESAFRRLESSALASALARRRVVLALGGGAVETLTNRLLLEQTPATLNVFLHAPFDVLQQRCAHHMNGAVRPVFADAAVAEQRFLIRLPFYRRIAGVTVETTDLDLTQTVDVLLARLAQHRQSGS
jgi:shikimate kinase